MPTPISTSPPGLRQLADRNERVFPSYPQAAHYFPAAAIEEARRRLSRAIERGDGPGLVVGAAGTGKSLLLQVLAAQFQDRFDVVLLTCARVSTPRALIQAILFEMGLPAARVSTRPVVKTDETDNAAPDPAVHAAATRALVTLIERLSGN